jgi:hypothetical protein
MYEISRYVSNNTLATAILLEEIVSLKNTIKKVIVASSMSIYGEGAYRDTMDRLVFPGVRAEEQLKKGIWEILDPDTAAPLEPVPTTEDSPLRPTSIYAIGKRDQEEMTLAVMGCIVNGPGESKAANIGISLPGTGEAPRCPVYIDGQKDVTLEGTYDELAVAFQALVDNYIAKKYPRKTVSVSA